jgi:hypothetical protein
MIAKYKFHVLRTASLVFTVCILSAAVLTGCGQKKPELSSADQQKITALNDALKNGVVTQQEYDAKLKEINGAAAIASTTSVLNSSSAAAAGGSTDFGPMKTVEITDPMFNMVAGTFSIPKSWNFEGTFLHGPGCQSMATNFVFRAYSPDMQYGLQQIPTTNFFWSDDQRAMPRAAACKLLQPISAEDYGKLIAVRVRPGAVVDAVADSPDSANFRANLDKTNQALASQAASMGMPIHIVMKGELKRLHIHYDLDGHPEEEFLTVGMTIADQPVSTMVNQPGQVLQTAWKHLLASNPTISGVRAPQGQLQSHIGAFEAIAKSYKPNPEYTQKVNAYMQDATNRSIAASWAVTNSILRDGAQQQAQRTQQAQAFIQNMQQEGDARNAQFNANMAQRDAHTRDVCDYLLDQQLYLNPTTGQTQTQSNQYNHTYSNGSGPGSSVVQSNSPNSSPQGVLAGNWTELQPIHHQ